VFGEYAPRVLDEDISGHILELLAQTPEGAAVIVAQERDAIERLAARLVEQPVLAGKALTDAITDAGPPEPVVAPPKQEKTAHGRSSHARHQAGA